MTRRAWIIAGSVAVVVLFVMAMFGTDLKYRITDLCNHTGGEWRTCYEWIAKPFES